MKRTLVLLWYILTMLPTWAGEKIATESIILTIQKDWKYISISAYAFCVQEFTLVLQRDTSMIEELCKNMSGRLNHIRHNETEDIYLTELLKIQQLRDSLSSYYSTHKEVSVKEFLDSLQKVPAPKVQKNKYHLFFKSFSDESSIQCFVIK